MTCPQIFWPDTKADIAIARSCLTFGSEAGTSMRVAFGAQFGSLIGVFIHIVSAPFPYMLTLLTVTFENPVAA